MWRNSLVMALRTMQRERLYTAINVVGLSLGIAAAILVFLYVRYETGHDRWIPDAERVHRLESLTTLLGTEPIEQAITPAIAAPLLASDLPEIEQAIALTTAGIVVHKDGMPGEGRLTRTLPEAIDFFGLRTIAGNPAQALSAPDGLVLTARAAETHFGTDDPIGRTLEIERAGTRHVLRVGGVIADLPEDSHLRLDMLGRADPVALDAGPEAWGRMDSYTYVRLRPGAATAAANARLPDFEARRMGMFDQHIDYRLTPVRDIHLGPALRGAPKPGGDPLAVRAFAVIAMLILLIACFNFTNLSTARASRRAREVGLRKVLGASRMQLAGQFLGESLLFAGAATLIGLALVELSLPFFNALLDVSLDLSYLGGESVLVPALALILLVGTVGGAYPAFYLSRFQPGQVLRIAGVPGGAGSGRLRTALVVLQFAIAIGLMLCAAVVYAQTLFARDADPGFQHRGLLVVEGLWTPEARAIAEPLARQVAALPGVTAVGFSGNSPTGGMRRVETVRRPAQEEGLQMESASVDYGTLATLGVPLLAGRWLSEANATDTAPPAPGMFGPTERVRDEDLPVFAVLLNQSAVRQLGFAHGDDALGEEVRIMGGRGIVAGIVGDVRYQSLRDPAAASVYLRDPANFNYLLVRFADGDPATLRERIEGLWRGLAPDIPYRARFAEDVLAEHYDADAVRGMVFALAAGLAVLIACLGLFGLAAFTVERRRLEIAVRKVFGARDTDIVRLMLWQFGRPVLIANLIAWPAAWWLMRRWLDTFGERIDLHPALFLGAGAIALLIASLTVTGQALRVSRTRPALALRHE